MADRITYVGLDVHKEGIVVAVAEGCLRGEVREYSLIANTAAALDRLLRKLGGMARAQARRTRTQPAGGRGGDDRIAGAPVPARSG